MSLCCNLSDCRGIIWLKFEMPDSLARLLFYRKNAPKGDYLGKGKREFTLLSLIQQSRTSGFYF